MLQNIFENATKYGYNPARAVEVSLKNGDAFVVLEVQDFGKGIPEQDQESVFEPFYRVDRSRSRVPGYGLGLGLCKRIVEMHGGKIFLNSRLGEGTRITIWLPV